MFTIALGAGVGILMLVFRVLEMKKNKAAIEKAQGEMKFEILDIEKQIQAIRDEPSQEQEDKFDTEFERRMQYDKR